MFQRVADAVAREDREKAQVYFNMMSRLEFLPNSPTLMNAGTSLQMLSACFVIPVPDSITGIMDAAKTQALVQKAGGGTGFSFSQLRPTGDIVKKTSGISSGPLSFMEVFNSTTETIKQGGKRRGANMAILRVDHPDILEFIRCKNSGTKFNNFNISVAITDAFMNALKNDRNYDLINPRTKTVAGSLNAQNILQEIAKEAWKTGDPGVIFIDTINDKNQLKYIGKIEATNPCGEQPLLPFESCNLGSINLSKFINTGNRSIDYKDLKEVTFNAVDFLDSVIDINSFATRSIAQASLRTRKIGLGVMGFADMLAMLGIPYESSQAVEIIDEIMGSINAWAIARSEQIANKVGPFKAYDKEVCIFKPRRNATLTTIAPTGSISLIAGCSSGIEPFFALAFQRKNILDGKPFTEFCAPLERSLKIGGAWTEENVNEIIRTGSIQGIKGISKETKEIYKTAHEISPKGHIAIQASAQRKTNNAVSKTVNLPHNATVETIIGIYMMAWDKGCKGVTVYRDNSRDEQVLVKGIGEQMPEKKMKIEQTPKKRPSRLSGFTEKIETSCGTLYVTINWNEEGKPFEVFTRIGKAGGCASSQSEAMGRLISMALRSGIEPRHIIKQLRGITCHLPKGMGKNKVSSCADAAAQILENVFAKEQEEITVFTRGACPDCQGPIEHEGGCSVCKQCGYSECG
jgi:ribonucleoside-diphosphate reductase alpha chain